MHADDKDQDLGQQEYKLVQKFSAEAPCNCFPSITPRTALYPFNTTPHPLAIAIEQESNYICYLQRYKWPCTESAQLALPPAGKQEEQLASLRAEEHVKLRVCSQVPQSATELPKASEEGRGNIKQSIVDDRRRFTLSLPFRFPMFF